MISYDGRGSFGGSMRPRDEINFVARPLAPRPAIPGISVAALAAYIGIPGGEASMVPEEISMISSMLSASVERLVEYAGYEPVSVQYEFRYDAHPSAMRYRHGAGPVFGEPTAWIELSRRPLFGSDPVTSVKQNGDEVQLSEVKVDAASNPPRVQVPLLATTGDDMAQIRIEVNVGDSSPDPRFVSAVLSLAAYTYDHRGCSMSGSLTESGAAQMVRGLRVARGGL